MERTLTQLPFWSSLTEHEMETLRRSAFVRHYEKGAFVHSSDNECLGMLFGHSRYLQEHEKSRSIFPASHVEDCDGTEEGYQDTDLFVDESVDTAEQAICNLLMADLHRALQQLSQKERSFILDYYGMEKPSTLQLAKRYGISQPAAHKRLKKIEEKIKKLVIDF